MKRIILLLTLLLVATSAAGQDELLDRLQDEISITAISAERTKGTRQTGDDESLVWEAWRWVALIEQLRAHPDYQIAAETDDRRAGLPGSISATDRPFAVCDAVLAGGVQDLKDRIAEGHTNPFRNNARTGLQGCAQAVIREIIDYQQKAASWFDTDYERAMTQKSVH